jgi:hypothetical protein
MPQSIRFPPKHLIVGFQPEAFSDFVSIVRESRVIESPMTKTSRPRPGPREPTDSNERGALQARGSELVCQPGSLWAANMGVCVKPNDATPASNRTTPAKNGRFDILHPKTLVFAVTRWGRLTTVPEKRAASQVH